MQSRKGPTTSSVASRRQRLQAAGSTLESQAWGREPCLQALLPTFVAFCFLGKDVCLWYCPAFKTHPGDETLFKKGSLFLELWKVVGAEKHPRLFTTSEGSAEQLFSFLG
jgi:hypothetical protein